MTKVRLLLLMLLKLVMMVVVMLRPRIRMAVAVRLYHVSHGTWHTCSVGIVNLNIRQSLIDLPHSLVYQRRSALQVVACELDVDFDIGILVRFLQVFQSRQRRLEGRLEPTQILELGMESGRFQFINVSFVLNHTQGFRVEQSVTILIHFLD